MIACRKAFSLDFIIQDNQMKLFYVIGTKPTQYSASFCLNRMKFEEIPTNGTIIDIIIAQ